MSIFKDHARLYRDAGLNVIPLKVRDKRPVIDDWARFAAIRVEDHDLAAWERAFPDGNIGLVLGPQSGVIMIDIDTDDQVLIKKLERVLPPSPWKRVGQKGFCLAYKDSNQRTWRIKDATTGNMVLECLARGAQVVLPPSIHPKTQRPYEANVPLHTVLDRLVPLPADIEERLRACCAEHGIKLSTSGHSKVTDFISAGSRDTTLTEHAGLFAYAILRGEMQLGQAIGCLRIKCLELSEKVAGDSVDLDKHVRNFIKFLREDIKMKGKTLPPTWASDLPAVEISRYQLEDLLEHQEWAAEECITYLREAFVKFNTDSPKRMEAIEEILKRLAGSKAMSKLDVERVLSYINETNAIGLRTVHLKQRVKEIKGGKIEGRDHSQIAETVLKDLKTTCETLEYNDKLVRFNGSNWEYINPRTVKAQISRDYGHLDGCKKNSDVHGIYTLMILRADTLVRNETLCGINFANGYLTDRLQLVDHDPAFGCLHTLPFRYDESAPPPMRFLRFLQDCWGHEADYDKRVLALREVFAATLFGVAPRMQRACMFFGAPKSGKSQLLRIMEELVPPEARSYTNPQDWNDTFLPAEMAGKLLNIAGELSENKLIEGAIFKEVVDGTQMTSQRKFGQPFKFRPTAMQVFASNHFPKSNDFSDGFLRRWLVFHFNRPVSADARVAEIGPSIVAEEREQIVAWAVPALPALLERSEYTLPPSHDMIIREMGYGINNVRLWLFQSGRVGREHNALLDEAVLYQSYWGFCATQGGQRPVATGQFRARMRELTNEYGFSIEPVEQMGGTSKMMYRGLSCKSG